MNTVICAGGSGVRVLEALLHLCAAGLGPPSLRILLIDPDSANGNGARVTGLAESYLEGHRRFGGRLGEGLTLFRTELDLLDVGGRATGLKTWSPVEKNQRLRDVINFDLLRSTPVPPELTQLFFTREELDMDLSQGFRGHPSVGAAAMSLVTLKTGEQPWLQLVQKLRGDLAIDEGARVFLTGSVFGGTGASTFYPIARFLRSVPEVNRGRLKIAAGALTPYFRFEGATTAAAASTASRQAAKAERFPLATRGAVDFYEHLRINAVAGSWPFDCFYWVGDDEPMSVAYAPGGPEQRNPAHFAEVLTALAALDFFNAPGELQGSCYAACGDPAEETSLDWRDLPLLHLERDRVRAALLRFFLVGSVHLGFAGPLVRLPEIERAPYRVPWYWERFASKGEHLNTEEGRASLDFLDRIFREHHFPWWRDIHGRGAVRLFNRSALDGTGDVRLDRLANLLWPDRAGEADPDAVDAFYTEMVKVPRQYGGTDAAASYLALLAHASDRFIDRHYNNIASKE